MAIKTIFQFFTRSGNETMGIWRNYQPEIPKAESHPTKDTLTKKHMLNEIQTKKDAEIEKRRKIEAQRCAKMCTNRCIF